MPNFVKLRSMAGSEAAPPQMMMRSRPPRPAITFLPTTLPRPMARRSRATGFLRTLAMIALCIFSASSGTARRIEGETSRMFSDTVRRFSTMLTSHIAPIGTRKFPVKAKAWCRGSTSRKLSEVRTVKY